MLVLTLDFTTNFLIILSLQQRHIIFLGADLLLHLAIKICIIKHCTHITQHLSSSEISKSNLFQPVKRHGKSNGQLCYQFINNLIEPSQIQEFFRKLTFIVSSTNYGSEQLILKYFCLATIPPHVELIENNIASPRYYFFWTTFEDCCFVFSVLCLMTLNQCWKLLEGRMLTRHLPFYCCLRFNLSHLFLIETNWQLAGINIYRFIHE